MFSAVRSVTVRAEKTSNGCTLPEGQKGFASRSRCGWSSPAFFEETETVQIELILQDFHFLVAFLLENEDGQEFHCSKWSGLVVRDFLNRKARKSTVVAVEQRLMTRTHAEPRDTPLKEFEKSSGLLTSTKVIFLFLTHFRMIWHVETNRQFDFRLDVAREHAAQLITVGNVLQSTESLIYYRRDRRTSSSATFHNN